MAYQSQGWREAVGRVMAAVSVLPERERAVIRGHYLEARLRTARRRARRFEDAGLALA
jgi:hypothetical protein